MLQLSRVESDWPIRGEVWLVSFDPSLGGEVQKTRPAVVVSNDTSNQLLNRVQVLPVSSKVDILYPAEALITLNGARRKAMADQITTASKQRLRRRMGKISSAEMNGIDRVVKIQLGIE